MNILFSIDDNYIEHIKTLIFSIMIHNRKEKICFYFLDGNLSKESKSDLKQVILGYGAICRFVFVEKSVFEKAPERKNISKETYYRLLAFELLPEVDKILYLDADILVTGSLAKLYHRDITNACIGAVLDQGEVQTDRIHKMKLGLKKETGYVNAGVLLMNLDRIRKTVTEKDIFDFIANNHHNLKYQDQDVINVMFEGEILLLEKNYNQSPLYESVEDFKAYYSFKRKYPTIIHYMGERTKPWKEWFYGYKYLRIYYGYCKRAGCEKLAQKLILPMLLIPLAVARQYHQEREMEV